MNTEEFYKKINVLYKPPTEQFTVIDVPEISYMVIDGKGDPDSEIFQSAVKWLYSMVHFIKPIVKKKMGNNFVEPPLESMFWANNTQDFMTTNKDKWMWRVMIVYDPELISRQDFQNAKNSVEAKLGISPVSFRIETFTEGKSVQILHVGNYNKVKAVCYNLYNEFLPNNSLTPSGHYHEIYLNDPSRTAPEKRKVILRQPVSQH